MKFDSPFSLTLAYACSYFRDTRCDTLSLPSDERAKRDSTSEKSPLFEDHGRVSISSKEVFALWPQSNTRGKRGLPFTLEIFPASRAFERGSRTFYQASSPPPPPPHRVPVGLVNLRESVNVFQAFEIQRDVNVAGKRRKSAAKSFPHGTRIAAKRLSR